MSRGGTFSHLIWLYLAGRRDAECGRGVQTWTRGSCEVLANGASGVDPLISKGLVRNVALGHVGPPGVETPRPSLEA